MVIADVGGAHIASPMRTAAISASEAIYKEVPAQLIQELQTTEPDFTVIFTEDKSGFSRCAMIQCCVCGSDAYNIGES